MLRKLLSDTRAQVGGRLDLMAVMITVISAGVTGYVGLSVMDNTQDSIDVTGTFGASEENLTEGIESFFSNLGTVFTVIILVVILSYLMLLRGR